MSFSSKRAVRAPGSSAGGAARGRSTRYGGAARAVGSFVPKITGKAFEKYGFSTAALLTDWAMIVGADLATYTLPERLKWPRNVDAYSETPDTERGRPGATLLMRVDGPRAIDVQYRSAQIMDRINAYFGYKAVTELRFVQAPVENHTVRMPSLNIAPASSPTSKTGDDGKVPFGGLKASEQKTVPSSTAAEMEANDEELLEAALDRLGVSVRSATLRD